ncbi:hypothetical protein HU200_065344 [Digitaria exilis]|uniref:Alpha/beta hydrolase fold-3 domain-containing protein n=1 Tax=Digitaria exilis TaxID=1010633 RepID=A0A835A275_9POAL|nr:hypothetical protein HU200_065344 [Digitaria exilis]
MVSAATSSTLTYTHSSPPAPPPRRGGSPSSCTSTAAPSARRAPSAGRTTAATGALVVSVEYRLAPEHPIPTAYNDAWSALRWATSSTSSLAHDPWLAAHADPTRTFVAGGNIAYHTAVRASRRRDLAPYFWGPHRLPSEAVWDGETLLPANGVDRLWPFVTGGQAGNDDPRINPPGEEIASLRERGVRLFDRVRDSYGGEATLVVSEGEDHGFHLYNPLRATSRRLMESIVHFVNRPSSAPEKNGGLHFRAWEGTSSSMDTATLLAATATTTKHPRPSPNPIYLAPRSPASRVSGKSAVARTARCHLRLPERPRTFRRRKKIKGSTSRKSHRF